MIALINCSLLAVTLVCTHYALLHVGNFYSLSSNNWTWLFHYIKTKHTAPDWFIIITASAFTTWLFLIVVANLLAVRIGGSTSFGKHDSKTLRGSAHWAKWKEIKATGLVRDTGVVVGAVKRGFKTVLLKHDGPEHILFEAPTRGGKGISLILYTLLTWLHSVIVLDIKGENWLKSSALRKLLGHLVLKFEPSAPEGSIRYNPLAEIRIGTDFEISDAQNIATMLIDPDGKGLKDFWMKSGFGWLASSLLHVMYVVQTNEGRCASLRDVSLYLSPANIDFDTMLQEMIDFDHGRQSVNEFVSASAGEMLNAAHPERSGVHSSAKTELMIYRDPIIAKNTETSDFRINDLMNGDRPAALYLVIPPRQISRLRPLVRVMMNQLLNTLMENEKHGKQTYKHRMLLMLDEFASMGKMEIFETALAYMASYGLKAFIVVQSVNQIIKHYGKENGIVSNCHITSCLTPNDDATAAIYQKRCGEATVIRKHKDRNRKALSISGNVSERQTEEKRPLLMADEALRLKKPKMSRKKGEEDRVVAPGEMLIFPSGTAPIRGVMPLYFQNKELAKLSKLPPVVDGIDDLSESVANVEARINEGKADYGVSPQAPHLNSSNTNDAGNAIRELANKPLVLEDDYV